MQSSQTSPKHHQKQVNNIKLVVVNAYSTFNEKKNNKKPKQINKFRGEASATVDEQFASNHFFSHANCITPNN